MPDTPEEVRQWARRMVDDLVASTLVPDQSPMDLKHQVDAAKNRITSELFFSGLSAEELGMRFSALVSEFAITSGQLVRLAAAGAPLGPAQVFLNFRALQDELAGMTGLQRIAALETLQRQAKRPE